MRIGKMFGIMLACVSLMTLELKAKASETIVFFPLESVNIDEGLSKATSMTIYGEIENRGYTIVDHGDVERRFRRENSSVETPSVDSESIAIAKAFEDPKPDAGELTKEVETGAETSSSSSKNEISVSPKEKESEPAPEPRRITLSDQEIKRAVAVELGCTHYLEGRLVALGNRINLQLKIVRTNGEIVASEVMLANSENDLPLIIPRIVEALIDQKTVKETPEVDNATQDETQNLSRLSRFETNFGILMGQAFGMGDMKSLTIVNFDGRFEFDDVLAEINTGLGIVTKPVRPSLIVDVAVGYYLTQRVVAPYLGVGMGIFIGDRMERKCGDDRASNKCDEFQIGWNVFPMFGLELLRQTSLRLHLDFRYLFSFTDSKFGHAPMALVGINF